MRERPGQPRLRYGGGAHAPFSQIELMHSSASVHASPLARPGTQVPAEHRRTPGQRGQRREPASRQGSPSAGARRHVPSRQNEPLPHSPSATSGTRHASPSPGTSTQTPAQTRSPLHGGVPAPHASPNARSRGSTATQAPSTHWPPRAQVLVSRPRSSTRVARARRCEPSRGGRERPLRSWPHAPAAGTRSPRGSGGTPSTGARSARGLDAPA